MTSSATTLSVGDEFPAGIVFQHAPPTDSEDVCGIIGPYKASEKFADKKAILISVPGAFTPGCHQTHLPGYLKNVSELKKSGVDVVVVIASNDAWVMEAWAKNRLNGVETEGVQFVFASDDKSAFSSKYGTVLGTERTGRYALLIDQGKVTYAGYDSSEIKDSAFEALQSKL